MIYDRCRNQWELERKAIYGKRVLLLGGYASDWMLGEDLKHGTFAYKDGNAYLAYHHPAFALYSGGQREWVRELYLLNALMKWTPERKKIIFTLVRRPAQLLAMARELSSGKPIAYDIETNTLSPFEATAKILSASFSDGECIYVVDWRRLGDQAVEAVRQVLENSDVPKIAMNCKFEILWFKKLYGIETVNLFGDPMVAQYLVGNHGSGLSLRQLAFLHTPEYVGYDFGPDYKDMESVDTAKLFEYNAAHAIMTQKIAMKLEDSLARLNMNTLYHDVLMSAEPALADMELNGLKLNRRLLESERKKFEKEIELTTKRLHRVAARVGMDDDSFNLNSVHYLRKLFFKGLRARPVSKTQKGDSSLNVDVLNILASRGNAEAELLLAYRAKNKIKSTYYDSYSTLSTDRNPYIHPHYNSTLTVTGRLSCWKPNIQNVPDNVRHVFISRFPGGKLVQADFRQIEMRVMAIESRDDGLMKIFDEGKDPHAMVAAAILGRDVLDIQGLPEFAELRANAKTINFLVLYGGSAGGLAAKQGLSKAQSQEFMRKFFEAYPNVERWQMAQRRKVVQGKPIRSLFGRMWKFPSVGAVDAVGNEPLNYPIQSTASDITQYTLGLVYIFLREEKLKAKLIATVHDSILVDCPSVEVEQVKSILETVVSGLNQVWPWMIVPQEIDLKVGDSWGEVS
jgi:DNA polymerase-1